MSGTRNDLCATATGPVASGFERSSYSHTLLPLSDFSTSLPFCPHKQGGRKQSGPNRSGSTVPRICIQKGVHKSGSSGGSTGGYDRDY